MVRDDNRDTCTQEGGMLPEPRSEEENDFLGTLTSDWFALGMNDEETHGTWVWNSDDSPVSWTNWHPGQPSGGDFIKCAAVKKAGTNGGGTWADIACFHQNWMDSIDKVLICQGMYFKIVKHYCRDCKYKQKIIHQQYGPVSRS